MNKLPTYNCLNLWIVKTDSEGDLLQSQDFKSLPVTREMREQSGDDLHNLGAAERARKKWRKAAHNIRAIVTLGKACREINRFGVSTFELKGTPLYQYNTARYLQRIRTVKTPSLEAKKPRPCFILDPQCTFRKSWNNITALLLVYTALIMPYRLAFSEDEELLAWSAVEWSVDGLFFLDVVITCFTALELQDGTLEIRLSRIVFRYATTWMALDVAACVPFSLLQPEEQSTTVPSSSYKSLVRLARLPRLYRLLRISKLYRVVSSGKIAELLERIQDCLALNRGTSKLFYFVLTVLVCMHITACLWYYLGKLQNFEPESWVARAQIQSRSELSRYIACAYWAIATLTTVGYGDEVGSTDLERIFCIVWMAFGIVIYGFTIGSLCIIIMRVNSKHSQLLLKLNAANQMVRESHLSHELQRQLRRALRYHSQRAELESKDKKMMFDALPKALRYEVACAMYGNAVSKIPFFQNRSPEWVSSVIPFLSYSYQDSGEYVYHTGDDSNELYVLLAGRADFILNNETIVFKRILEGSYFGDVEMIQRRKRICSCAMESNGELLVMKRTLLKLIETDFPEVYLEMEALAQKRLAHLLANKHEVEETIEKMDTDLSPPRRRSAGVEPGSSNRLYPTGLRVFQ